MNSVLCLLQLNICFSLQVNKTLTSELVCLVPLVPQVNMLCLTVVFAHDRGQYHGAMSRARCCILNVVAADPSCVMCCIRDRLPSTDRVYTGFQVSQLP